MRKKFKHNPVDLGYSDLKSTTTDSGRKYVGPDGQLYPSVTTVLGALKKQSILEWRQRVGEKEANKISRRASSRGTAVHNMIEKYIDNDPEYTEGYLPNIISDFQNLKPILDQRLDVVYAQEAALYSDHLRLAGRVDCVGYFDGKRSIIDFKTSLKPKRKEWIENYFMQAAAYAIMWEERTRVPVTQLVVLISVDNESPQVFIEHRDNWTEKLLDAIEAYKR
ncbi:MAG: exonuclease [Muricauda sp. TMED12]|nr:MAG: exonuclease [Muricauda sp. TMED12]